MVATATATATTKSSSSKKKKKDDNGGGGDGEDWSSSLNEKRSLRIFFVHLDWGIGGAEQLMLQLAQASVGEQLGRGHGHGHSVQLFTSHCNPKHCFAPLQPETGTLYPLLHIYGAWIPETLPHPLYPFTHRRWGRALCSTIRLLYICYQVHRQYYNQIRTAITTTNQQQQQQEQEQQSQQQQQQQQQQPASQLPDVIVLDGLPTPLPFLKYWFPTTSLLFYCHFPDQLLTTATTATTTATATTTTTATNKENNEEEEEEPNPFLQALSSSSSSSSNHNNKNKGWYRRILDGIENATLPFADTIVVNSQFTREIVYQTFPSLQTQQRQQQSSSTSSSSSSSSSSSASSLPVLYPALDTTALDQNNPNQQQQKQQQQQQSSSSSSSSTEEDEDAEFLATLPYYDPTQPPPFVSLNRYERKKNVKLVLEAVLWIYQTHYHNNNNNENNNNNNNENKNQNKNNPTTTTTTTTHQPFPPIVIAGGYDPKNVENIEYRGELQQLVETHFWGKNNGNNNSDNNAGPFPFPKIYFRHSISDRERTFLLHHALAVVYTPSWEHFGIVPIEAMYCGTPVIAVHNGGPNETILHNQTGYLCPPTPPAFGRAMLRLVQKYYAMTNTTTTPSTQPPRNDTKDDNGKDDNDDDDDDDSLTLQQMGQLARQHVLERFVGQDRFASEWNALLWETVQRGQGQQSLEQQQQQRRRRRRFFLWWDLGLTVLDALGTAMVLYLVWKFVLVGSSPRTSFSLSSWFQTLLRLPRTNTGGHEEPEPEL